jgi:hypothetical protein
MRISSGTVVEESFALVVPVLVLSLMHLSSNQSVVQDKMLYGEGSGGRCSNSLWCSHPFLVTVHSQTKPRSTVQWELHRWHDSRNHGVPLCCSRSGTVPTASKIAFSSSDNIPRDGVITGATELLQPSWVCSMGKVTLGTIVFTPCSVSSKCLSTVQGGGVAGIMWVPVFSPGTDTSLHVTDQTPGLIDLVFNGRTVCSPPCHNTCPLQCRTLSSLGSQSVCWTKLCL